MELVKGFYVATFYGAVVDVPAGAITLPDADGTYHTYKVIPRGYTNTCSGKAPFSLIKEDGTEWTDIWKIKTDPIKDDCPDDVWYHTGIIGVEHNRIRGAWDKEESGAFRVMVNMTYYK